MGNIYEEAPETPKEYKSRITSEPRIKYDLRDNCVIKAHQYPNLHVLLDPEKKDVTVWEGYVLKDKKFENIRGWFKVTF